MGLAVTKHLPRAHLLDLMTILEIPRCWLVSRELNLVSLEHLC